MRGSLVGKEWKTPKPLDELTKEELIEEVRYLKAMVEAVHRIVHKDEPLKRDVPYTGTFEEQHNASGS